MFTNVTLLFVVLLFPLAGFIAWAGDRIGHRTGKKRHTLLGLRPRHTAILFTVGSGVLIVAVSFGFFWLSSESFRIVVQQGETLYRNNLRLKNENTKQAEAIRLARIQESRIRAEADKFNQERREAEEANTRAVESSRLALDRQKEAEARAKETQNRYQEAATRLGNAQRDLETARKSLIAVQGQLARKTDQVHIAETQIKSAEKRRALAEEQVRNAKERVAVAERQQRDAQKEASEARKSAVQLVRNAETQRRKMEDDLKKTTSSLQEQKDLYTELQQQTESQRAELTRLTAELDQKRAEFALVAASSRALRGRQITYQVGEEVDRIAIRPGYNVWRLQAILYSFLTKAAKKAEGRGAARARDERAVVIPTIPVVNALTTASALGKHNDVKPFTEDDAVSAAASSIRRANEDVVVVAMAQANAVSGEPVAVRLEIYRNPVVLDLDAKLAEVTINGEGSRQEVADALYNFLNRDVHRRLVEAGMIPIAKGGDSGSAGTEAPRLEEFTLSGEEWLELMDQVRHSGSRAKIIAYAGKTMRAGDPVSLRFEVKGRPTPPLQTALDRWP